MFKWVNPKNIATLFVPLSVFFLFIVTPSLYWRDLASTGWPTTGNFKTQRCAIIFSVFSVILAFKTLCSLVFQQIQCMKQGMWALLICMLITVAICTKENLFFYDNVAGFPNGIGYAALNWVSFGLMLVATLIFYFWTGKNDSCEVENVCSFSDHSSMNYGYAI